MSFHPGQPVWWMRTVGGGGGSSHRPNVKEPRLARILWRTATKAKIAFVYHPDEDEYYETWVFLENLTERLHLTPFDERVDGWYGFKTPVMEADDNVALAE